MKNHKDQRSMKTPKQKITKYFLELTIAILVKFWNTLSHIFFFVSDIHWFLPILLFFLYINDNCEH